MIDTREELINALHEAAELEHGLLLQYLYAALSLKRRTDEGLSAQDQALIGDWERLILRVAVEEMAHLGTVCNLLSAIGAAPHFRRPTFPQPVEKYYPFDFQLERLNDATLYRFLCFELPVGEPPPEPPRHLAPLDAAPEPIAYSRVGELYTAISDGFARVPNLFIGPPENQDEDDWGNNMSLRLVRDLPTAQAAIAAIIVEGEGTPQNREQSHYGRFLAIRAALRARSDLDPARAVVKNPLTREHRDTADDADVNYLTHPQAKLTAELFAHVYQTMLLLLGQYYAYSGETQDQRAAVQAASRQLMSTALRPLAEQLTQMPAGDAADPRRAGPTFESFGDVTLAPALANRWIILQERLATEIADCTALAAQASGPADPLHRIGSIGESIRLIAANVATATQP